MSSQNSQEHGKPLDQSQFNETAAAEELTCRMHAERASDGQVFGEVESDTTPSNTVSRKYNDGVFMPLRWGVDSLYLSFPGDLSSSQESRLKELKQLAQSQLIQEQALAQMTVGNHLFEVKDKGAGMFPYVLEDNCYRIQLSRSTSKSLPMAYVRISSEYLTHKKPAEVVDELRKVLNELGSIDYMPKVSRIDLFVDFVSSVDMESWDRHAWVTKANSVNQYSIKGVFSGWTVGLGGTVAARLYNKLLELDSSKKDYLIPLWAEAGWNKKQYGDVWRLEFQFKRDILAEFNIQSFSTTMSHLNGLWSYATTQWLRLAIPSDEDTNRSRWLAHPLWGCLAEVDFDSDGGPLSRQFSPERVPSDQRLFNHGFSVISSFMAREGITDFYQGIEAFRMALYQHLNNRAINDGAYFDNYVEERIAAKARKFNSILSRMADDPVSDADEYRKQSDGE